jgi:hypothetical protein
MAVLAAGTIAPSAHATRFEYWLTIAKVSPTVRIRGPESPFLIDGVRGWYVNRDLGYLVREYSTHPSSPFPVDGSILMHTEGNKDSSDRTFKIIWIEFHHPDMNPGAILNGIDFETETGQRRIVKDLSTLMPNDFIASRAAKKTLTDGRYQYSSGGKKGGVVDFTIKYPIVWIKLWDAEFLSQLIEQERALSHPSPSTTPSVRKVSTPSPHAVPSPQDSPDHTAPSPADPEKTPAPLLTPPVSPSPWQQ